MPASNRSSAASPLTRARRGVFERAISTWVAFYWRIRYGGYPFGKRMLKKGIGRDWIEGGRIAAKVAERPNR